VQSLPPVNGDFFELTTAELLGCKLAPEADGELFKGGTAEMCSDRFVRQFP
jgi:hypothetical protein